MSCVTLQTFVEDRTRKKCPSLDSDWLNNSDFGECDDQNSDPLFYPCLIPVYNGEVLNIKPEFVHASLSGISIKHYYGKCYQEVDIQDDNDVDTVKQESDYYGTVMYGEYEHKTLPVIQLPDLSEKLEQGLTETSGSFEYRDEVFEEGQPLCTVPKINHRNSFWNIHRPELCKLTWAQNYVGASTVIGHLHEHLMSHGILCMNFHTEEDRENLLKTELDEYVRLKVLANERELPPDEPIFSLHEPIKVKSPTMNKKCIKIYGKRERKPVREASVRFIHLNDDEEDLEQKQVRRSKEEFCITIGKHIRKPPVTWTPSVVGEDYICGEYPSFSEYGRELFYFNWCMYAEEESCEDLSDEKSTNSTEESGFERHDEPCQPLIMDEFCRAAGKVDLSDLRCNPDDF